MEKIYTRKEASQVLGVSITTLDTARQNGQIAYIQYVPNGCIYFTESNLRDYITKSTHRANPVIQKETYRKRRNRSLSR